VLGLILGLLVLWVIVIAVGIVFKALLWLSLLGLVAFAVTVVWGLAHTTKRP
jgi:hypothetical protein